MSYKNNLAVGVVFHQGVVWNLSCIQIKSQVQQINYFQYFQQLSWVLLKKLFMRSISGYIYKHIGKKFLGKDLPH